MHTKILNRTELVAKEISNISKTGDLVMVLTLLISTIASIAIGQYYDDLNLALLGSGLILGLGCASFFISRGRSFSWIILTSCNVIMVAMHIQLSRGTIVFHFGVKPIS